MELIAQKKNIVYLIGIFSLALFFLVIFSSFLSKTKSPYQQKTTSALLTPTSVLTQVSIVPQLSIVPQTIKNLPTFTPDKGKGVDIQSKQAQDSIAEIQKLSPFIPFTQNLALSTGLNVSILIPPRNLQDNPWTLTVQIFGIDYEIPQSDASYLLVKNSFREAVNIVFNWMKNKSVDPQKLIINWGDRKFIQDRAEEWLTDLTK